jgi:hypothetical protein
MTRYTKLILALVFAPPLVALAIGLLAGFQSPNRATNFAPTAQRQATTTLIEPTLAPIFDAAMRGDRAAIGASSITACR